MLLKIIQGKASVQARVQELLQLRAAAKEQRAAGAGGATSSAGAGAASGSLPGGSLLSTGGGLAGVDAERRLQERLHSLAAVLRDVSKPEEGERSGWAWLWGSGPSPAAFPPFLRMLVSAVPHPCHAPLCLRAYGRRPAAPAGAA